jgi:hypothetical protein
MEAYHPAPSYFPQLVARRALSPVPNPHRCGTDTCHIPVYVPSGKEEEVCSLAGIEVAGTIGSWAGLAPDGDPIVLRDLKSEDIYELLLER